MSEQIFKNEMKRSLGINVVELEEIYVAGLAIRTNNRTEQELGGNGWIAKTWDEVKEMTDPNPPAAIYTGYASDKDGDFSVVIGFRRSAAKDFKTGEIISKIPAGKYAKFSRKGPLPDVVIEAWKEVWQAEAEGKLNRAYTADLELYPGMGDGSENVNNLTVELYIAVK